MSICLPTALHNKRLTDDTRTLQTGDVFAFDARLLPEQAEAFCQQAINKGASAVFCNIHMAGVTFHEAPGQLLAAYAKAQFPKQPPHILAVTGTNGKTSVAWFTAQLLQAAGKKVASIGTLGVYINGKKTQETGYTSPTALQLHTILHNLAEQGVEVVVIEASSHALALHRLDAVELSAAAFTNLTQDHLDFHGDMDTYAIAKGRLFSDLLPQNGTAILPSQKEAAWPYLAMAKQRDVNVLTYGSAAAELVVLVESATAKGLHLTVKLGEQSASLMVAVAGLFQAENLAASIGFALAQGVSFADICTNLPKLSAVPGRMEMFSADGKPACVVDYAHTPDALKNALESLRPLLAEKGKLWVVFGAGGDRDATKRPLMGRVANELADHVIITDDNPRTENAANIREAIAQETPKETLVPDRAEAIAYAIEHATENDVILIAGKGHEEGQIIGKKTTPFNDVKMAISVLKRLS